MKVRAGIHPESIYESHALHLCTREGKTGSGNAHAET